MYYRKIYYLRDALVWMTGTLVPKNGNRVLIFHDIHHPTLFRKKMIWLKNNFRVVPLSEAVHSSSSQPLIALTFDDGYQSWYTNVYPILKELEIPATFFVNSGLVNLEETNARKFLLTHCHRKEPFLRAISWTELIKIANDNLFNIGGHTTNHFDISPQTPVETLQQEIILDKNMIEKRIGNSIHWFAYPYGQPKNATLNAQAVAQQAGYQGAFTILPGFVNKNSHPYTLSRDSLYLEQSTSVWKAWLQGGYDPWVRLKNSIYRLLKWA